MKLLKRITSALTAAAMAVSMLTPWNALAFDDTSVQTAVISDNISEGAGEALFSGYGASQKDSFTLMIYMCGSNLESMYKAASDDIAEIIKGYSGKKVNIIIQTGGSTKWHSNNISSRKNQRFKVTSEGLQNVDRTLGQRDMGRPETLSDFINFCRKNYPAKRYGLLMWDHGGGTIGGFGSDLNYDYSSLSLTEMDKAFRNGGVHFDFIAFDACIMATLEMCLIARDNADYLIAAESSLPAMGIYYTDWIRQLCRDPSVSTVKLGSKIADDCMKMCLKDDKYADTDMGVIDLKKVTSEVLPALDAFSKKNYSLLKNMKYHVLAKYRSSLDIEDRAYELVDIISYAESCGSEKEVKASAAKLKAAVKSALVYHKSSSKYSDYNGLSMLFPFENLHYLDELSNIYKSAGYSTYYTTFLEYYANIMAGGQEYYLVQRGASKDKARIFRDCRWYNPKMAYSQSYYSKYYLGSGELKLKKKGDTYIIPLTETNRWCISDYVLQMFWEYNSRYMVDMGYDNVIGYDKNGDLVIDYCQDWVALDGIVVPSYYMGTEKYGKYERYFSIIPCIYENYEAALVLMWDNRNYTKEKGGKVYGVIPAGNGGPSKGIHKVKDGDVFRIMYDFYTYDYKYTDTRTFDEEEFIINGDISVTYEDVPSQLGGNYVYGKITDIYGNRYYTEDLYF